MLALSSFAAASSPLPRCRCCRRLCLVIESVQDLVQNAAAYCAATTAAADVAGCTRHDAKTSRESRLLSSANVRRFDCSLRLRPRRLRDLNFAFGSDHARTYTGSAQIRRERIAFPDTGSEKEERTQNEILYSTFDLNLTERAQNSM